MATRKQTTRSRKTTKPIKARGQPAKPLATRDHRGYWRRLVQSVWFFPLLALVPLVILTATRISGTSVGVYHDIAYGETKADPDLLAGHPRPIRSDEWLVTTQLTIAQAREGYPKVNQNLGNGKDLSVVGSIPFKDWSSVFKPENVGFFVLPLENGFAFRWWFMLYLLVVSAYFFTLRLSKNKRFAILFGTATALSPFVFWWYANVTTLTLAFAFLIMILTMRLIDDEPVTWLKRFSPLFGKVATCLGLVYVLTAFALIVYPPFQIPVGIVMAAFLLGYFLNRIPKQQRKAWLLRTLVPLAACGLVAGILLAAFVATRSEAIHALTNTAYPGKRIVLSGHLHPLRIFDSFVQPQLTDDLRGANFFTNQSEASNFILLSPFLLLPALFLAYYERRKFKRFDWAFIFIQLSVIFFFVRVFVPFGSGLFRFFGLSSIPNERLLIGIGLASVLLTLLLINKLRELKIQPRAWRLPIWAYSLSCLAIILVIGFTIAHDYPKFLAFPPKVIVLSVSFWAIIHFVLTQRKIWAATILLLFSLYSVYNIHPLYRGLGWLNKNGVSSSMQAVSKADDTWVTADNLVFENFGALSDHDSISGVQAYPEVKLWQQADPSAAETYNRYAHVVFVQQPNFESTFKLMQSDLFVVGLRCTPFFTQQVDFVLDTTPIDSPCLTLKKQVEYPAAKFYLYEVTPQ